MKEARFSEWDDVVLLMLRERPRPAYAVAHLLGLSKDEAFLIIRRLKSKDRAYYYNGRWHECASKATKDTSIFPPPKHNVPKIGFFG